MPTTERHRPGEIRDVIMRCMQEAKGPLTVGAIRTAVEKELGPVAPSSVRSYLNINTGPGKAFERLGRGTYKLR